MTESELLTLFIELDANSMVLLAYCASVTTALYTIAYVVGTKLHIGSVVSLTLLFLGILAYLLNTLGTYGTLSLAVIESLSQLKSNGAELLPVSETLIGAGEVNSLMQILILLLSMFPIGGVGYLIYQYRIGRASTSVKTEQN